MKKAILTDAAKKIYSAGCLVGITTGGELADQIGMPRTTMYGRLEHPETFRLFELRAIAKATGMSDEVLLQIVKGGEK